MTNNQLVYRKLFERYRSDPVFFVQHALGHYTWSKQREILRSIAKNEKTAVRACHGCSKTFTAAEAVVWFLNCFPKSKVVTMAPRWLQVKELLWAEINAIYMRSRIRLKGVCQQTTIRVEDEPDHYAIGFSTDEPARAEGWHAPAILFIFDEAKGIPQWLWDTVRGLSIGGFCRWLVISTTDGVQVGENFWKIFRENGEDWSKIHISYEMSPYVTGEKFKYIDIPDPTHPEVFIFNEIDPSSLNIQIATQKWADDCKREWGQDSVLVLTKVKGEIADEGADTIIKLSQVEKMFANHADSAFNAEGRVEVGVDVSRGGGDDTVFIMRKGLKVLKWRIIPPGEFPAEAKTVYLANCLEDFVDRNKKTPIKTDDTGVGGGLTDIMESRGYNVIPINFQTTPASPDKYPNTISEMWFETARILHEIACPKDERLQTELVNRKRLPLDKKGRRVIESKDDYKKRGFRSPDMADAFLLTFYNPYGEKGADVFVYGETQEDRNWEQEMIAAQQAGKEIEVKEPEVPNGMARRELAQKYIRFIREYNGDMNRTAKEIGIKPEELRIWVNGNLEYINSVGMGDEEEMGFIEI